MKRIFITGLALLAFMRASTQNTSPDSTGYRNTELKLEEINLVSSYYKQDGNNAAVTGGIGSEKLTDLSNTIDLRLVKYGKTGKKHMLDIEAGIDHYTSASSDKIDLQANSSASSADNRFYPSLHYTIENEQNGDSFGVGISSSTEFDYQSFGANVSYSKKTADKSKEFSARFQAYLDQVKLVLPVELRTPDAPSGTESRNTFAASLGYLQIVNRNLQFVLLADVIAQYGYLSLPFHRVYFTDGSVHQEQLPDTRLKIPLAVRANYFLGDHVIIRAYYRYYADDWKLKAHTAEIEVPVKLSPFFSVSPFYRYYTQRAVKYFKAYGQHDGSEPFFTSNFDLSGFDSNFMGLGFKYSPLHGVFGLSHLQTLEMRYGHYAKTTQMSADIVSIHLRYK